MVLVFAGMNTVMRAMGSLGSLHEVMQGIEVECTNEQRPCWYGVMLGETTPAEVEVIFTRRGDRVIDNPAKYQLEIYNTYHGGCFAQFVYGQGEIQIINEIILTNCRGVRLGDLLAYFGTPLTLGAGVTCKANRQQTQHNHYYVEYPNDGILASVNRPASLSPWLSLHGHVRQLYIVNPHEGEERSTWEGLIGFWHFVRLHPEQINMTNCWP